MLGHKLFSGRHAAFVMAAACATLVACASSESPETFAGPDVPRADAGAGTDATGAPDASSGVDSGSGGIFSNDDSGTSTHPQTCAETAFGLEPTIVEVMLVLDRSNSMTTTGLWPKIQDAVLQIVTQTGARVHWGLMLYPDPDFCDPDDIMPLDECAAPTRPSVDIKDVSTYREIESKLAMVGTCGGTPTASALNAALTTLRDRRSLYKRYVLLATDGGPNCNMGLSTSSCVSTAPGGVPAQNVTLCLDDKQTIAAAKDLNTAGIPVYVLGLGESITFKNVMNNIAKAGGTTSYTPVSDATQIAKAFSQVTSAMVSCEFNVRWDNLPAGASKDQSLVNVYRDGASEPLVYSQDCSDKDGWTWKGTDSVMLCTNSCQRAKTGEWKNIRTTFGCVSRGPR